MNLNTHKSFRVPKINLSKRPATTTAQATEPDTEKPAVTPEAVTPQPAQPPRHWPSSPRASVGAQSRTIGQRPQPGWLGTHPVYGEPIASPGTQDSEADSSANDQAEQPSSPRRLAQARLPPQQTQQQQQRPPITLHSPQQPAPPGPVRLEPPHTVTLEQRLQEAGQRLQTAPLLSLLKTLYLSGETLGEQALVPLLALCANTALSLPERRALFKATVALLAPLPEGGAAHRLCFQWIGTMGKPNAQERWRAIYDQRAQPLKLLPASEDAQNSALPPDDWIF